MFCELPICECGFHPIGFLYPRVLYVGVGYSALFFRRTFVLVCVFCFSLLFAFLLVNSITCPLFYSTFVVSFFLFLFSDSEFLLFIFTSSLL